MGRGRLGTVDYAEYTQIVARSTVDVIPEPIRTLAKTLRIPSADWYVASAESGRGGGALAALEQIAEEQAAAEQPNESTGSAATSSETEPDSNGPAGSQHAAADHRTSSYLPRING
jgi:hypothetical protein